jgi:hypothetical protein
MSDNSTIEPFENHWEPRNCRIENGPYRIDHRAAGQFELTTKRKSLGVYKTQYAAKVAAVEDFKNRKAETPPVGAKFSLWVVWDRLSYHRTYDEARQAALDHADRNRRRSVITRFRRHDKDEGVFKCWSYCIGPATYVPAPSVYDDPVITATNLVLQPHRLTVVNTTETAWGTDENQDSTYLPPEGKDLLKMIVASMTVADLARLCDLGNKRLASKQP